MSTHTLSKEQVKTTSDRRWAGSLYLKALFDLTFSLMILPILAGPMILIALAIRLDSSGPAIFRQIRVGLGGRRFVLYKFRTMRSAESDAKHQAYVKNWIKAERAWSGTDTFKIMDDDRVTKVGGFLRRTSLDELPQIFNVIKGQMSLVGPRPAIPYEVELYDEGQLGRLAAKPGISGLWQVSGRSSVSFQEMVALDLHYIEKRSVWMDLGIIARTLPALIRTKGW